MIEKVCTTQHAYTHSRMDGWMRERMYVWQSTPSTPSTPTPTRGHTMHARLLCITPCHRHTMHTGLKNNAALPLIASATSNSAISRSWPNGKTGTVHPSKDGTALARSGSSSSSLRFPAHRHRRTRPHQHARQRPPSEQTANGAADGADDAPVGNGAVAECVS
uniref:Uncharacterized protein n=1 Tax=Vitrella brassicaformis TaxID=1169539 RepID=A0A7S1PCK0_9ALVE|mmetsp:Transcript_52266/g.131361  ORF Transcript_52266/g.131361 Transcript_52266/m.131361 type:complete len:163 (+) Transcript_52266:248-736(+)